jgi:hypothetical protein
MGLFVAMHHFGQIKMRAIPDVMDFAILGLIAVWYLATFFTIFLPARKGLFESFLILFIMSGIASWRLLAHFLQKIGRTRLWKFLVILPVLTFCFVCSWQAAGDAVFYDTRLYHMQSVAWIREYGIVPGLANLHSRLGYHSSFHTFAAMFETGILYNKSVHVTLGLLCILVLLKYVNSLQGLNRTGNQFQKIFLILIVPLLLNFGFDLSVASFSTDSALTLVSTLFFILLIQLPTGSFKNIQMFMKLRKTYVRLPLLLGLGAITFTTKFPGVSMLLVGGLLLLAYIVYSRPWMSKTQIYPTYLIVSTFAFLLIHTIGTIVLSGYPFFPLPALPVFTPWMVPMERAQQEIHAIKAWARMNSTDVIPPFMEWFQPWLAARWATTQMLCLAAGFLTMSIGLGARIRKVQDLKSLPLVPILAATVLLIHTSIWFIGAPDFRFFGGFFWLFFAVGFAFSIDRFQSSWVMPISFGLLFILIIDNRLLTPALTARPSAFKISSAKPVPTKVRILGVPVAPFPVQVPIKSDACENAPIPCTPFPDERLRLRVAGNLAKGMYIEQRKDRSKL